MPLDLRSQLPLLLPQAIAWANTQAEQATARGEALPAHLQEVARQVGVQQPERIRLLRIAQPPFPDEPALRSAAIQTGLLGPTMAGLTLGYSILVTAGNDTLRVISHECRHVHQYETFGSIDRFLAAYLQQIIDYGYHDAPLEIDAREHEMNSL